MPMMTSDRFQPGEQRHGQRGKSDIGGQEGQGFAAEKDHRANRGQDCAENPGEGDRTLHGDPH